MINELALEIFYTPRKQEIFPVVFVYDSRKNRLHRLPPNLLINYLPRRSLGKFKPTPDVTTVILNGTLRWQFSFSV